MTQKITAIITEKFSPKPPAYPAPLIYALDVDDPKDEISIRRQVAAIRLEEIGWENEQGWDEKQMLEDTFEGIELHFVFEGDLTPMVDFRG